MSWEMPIDNSCPDCGGRGEAPCDVVFPDRECMGHPVPCRCVWLRRSSEKRRQGPNDRRLYEEEHDNFGNGDAGFRMYPQQHLQSCNRENCGDVGGRRDGDDRRNNE